MDLHSMLDVLDLVSFDNCILIKSWMNSGFCSAAICRFPAAFPKLNCGALTSSNPSSAKNHGRCFFTDHDSRGIGISRHNSRHD